MVPPGEMDQAWDAIEEWVQKHEPFYEKVDQALRDPHCSFAVDHREAWNAVVPSIPISQVIAEMYEWRVRVAEHRGRPARASLGDCMTLLAWGRRVERGWTICYAVSATVDQIACKMLQRVAGMRGFDAGEARSALDMELVRAEDPSAMWDAFDGERASMIHLVRTVSSAAGVDQLHELIGEEGTPSPWFHVGITFVRPLLWANGVDSLRHWKRARRILKDGAPSALDELHALGDEWEGDEPSIRRASAAMFHRTPYHLYRARLRHLAHLRIARAGLNALTIRSITGKWPDGNTGHKNPFTGKPLMLVPKGNGVHIEAAVPWLDKYDDEEFREEERIYWTLE